MSRVQWLTRWLIPTPVITSVWLQGVGVHVAPPPLPHLFTLTVGPTPVVPGTLWILLLGTGDPTNLITRSLGQVTSTPLHAGHVELDGVVVLLHLHPVFGQRQPCHLLLQPFAGSLCRQMAKQCYFFYISNYLPTAVCLFCLLIIFFTFTMV